MNISDLPDGLRHLAEQRRTEFLLKNKERDHSDNLFSDFGWTDTKEGFQFWDNVCSGNFEQWDEDQRKEIESQENAIYSFGTWLVENCEIKDGIFQYDSEDYSLEGIIKSYKIAINEK